MAGASRGLAVKPDGSSGARAAISGILRLGLATSLLLAAFVVMVQVSPRYVGMGDDSGLFAYGGDRILSGDLLYREIWDTKPPGVFYLNALAQVIGGATPWAIWWFQLAWIALSVLTLFLLLSRLYELGPAALAMALLTFTMLYPGYFQGGNLTETYGLLPQVLGLCAAAGYFSTGRRSYLPAIGLTTAAAFLIKPTLIAVGAAAGVTVALRAFQQGGGRHALREAVWIGAGFAAPVSLAAAYWALQGALDDLWGAVFSQNVTYIGEGFSLRGLWGTLRRFFLDPPLATLTAFSAAGLVLFGISEGWPIGQARKRGPESIYTDPSDPVQGWKRWFTFTAFLALPLEFAFVALSGRNFGHYFITPLPAMAVGCAYLFSGLRAHLRKTGSRSVWRWVVAAAVGVLFVVWLVPVLPGEVPELAHLSDLTQRPLWGEYWTDDLERYVIEQSRPEDTVLVWGYNPGLHFLTGRRAPSRYLFHAQLFTPGAAGERRFSQFLRDLDADPPALIVAQSNSQHQIPFFGDDDESFCAGCSQESAASLRQLRARVESDYQLIEEIDGWLVYRRGS